MEATTGVATNRAGSSPISSSRKEWRAVSEHQQMRNAGNEELERLKLGQSDERTIYEVQQGRQTLDFCSITIDGNSNNDILQQLQSISRKREDLLQLEIELRAQMIAKSEIAEMQNNFDAQMKEHADAAAKLQEQLHEREQAIHDLERRMEEKDRELISIKRDNEAAWAKEDLLREQKKELATFRRERDHSEAERMQHLQQIHDLQEHIEEKERQLMDLQEQYRGAQETMLYKDEQLREAQAWIARVQEMDALQSHSLQSELRERTEQCNQLWLGWQRQIADMERFHLHTVQQLQLELADLRERSGSFADESGAPRANLKDASQFGQHNGNQPDAGGSNGSSVLLQNGSSGSTSINISSQNDRAAGIQLGSSSLLGLPQCVASVASGQVTALHPFAIHQQGVQQSMQSNVSPSQVSHHPPISSMPSSQHWQNEQHGVPGEMQISEHGQLTESQKDPNFTKSETRYGYELSVNGGALQREYLDVHGNPRMEPDSSISSSNGEAQVAESVDRSYLESSQNEQSLQQMSSQFHAALNLEPHQQDTESKEEDVSSLTNHEVEAQVSKAEQRSDANGHDAAAAEFVPEMGIATEQTNKFTGVKISETDLLDEKSLLACIVRTIPAGGRIRISSTLPNRLGKMLAPLHWHDYKRKYGKLDDFVASRPEFFVIEGDYIQLREGAQEMIAATAAVAKVAAAAAASAPYSSSLPSVAVTPMAQTRLRSFPSIDNKHANAVENGLNTADDPFGLSTGHMHSNGISFGIAGGSKSNVKLLSKSKDSVVSNGLDTKSGQSSSFIPNGAHLDKVTISNTQNKALSNGRLGSSTIGRQQGRASSHTSASRR